MRRIVCMGMAVADIVVAGAERLPTGGRTEYVEQVDLCPGGDALNQAMVLAALGHRSALISIVGADRQGGFLVDACARRGVDVSGVSLWEGGPTATSLVFLDQSGERSFLSVRRGASREGRWKDVQPERWIGTGTGVLSIGSLGYSEALDTYALVPALRRAREVGALTCADLVPDRGAVSLKRMGQALSLLDYILPSREEAVLYTGARTADQAADALLELGCGHVVLKLGGQGVFYKDKERRLMLRAYPARAIDTTGAGDNFVAGFLSAAVEGGGPEDCLRWGAATAAVSVGSVGASTGVRDKSQVEQLLRQAPNVPFVPDDITL